MRAHDSVDEPSPPPRASASAPSFPLPPPADSLENPGAGADFAQEARLLFRVAACGGNMELPATVDRETVAAHCRELAPKIASYRSRYLAIASPFLHDIEPKDLPTTVVYPFSGGDLTTALLTYPDAAEITTLSLELAGDPRRIRSMDKDALAVSLRKLRFEVGELLGSEEYSRSETLKKTQRGDIPGELGFFLVGLSIHGYEPVSLRYFTVRSDGSLHYLSGEEIGHELGETADHRKSTWTSPDFSEAFANSEIGFRAIGDAAAPMRIHRHIAANLANEALLDNPGVLAHLKKKGEVSAMVKAASYLLWNDGFSKIRSYLIEHARYIVSDSTGIPPSFAKAGGLTQETYGIFKRSLLHASFVHNQAFRELWTREPLRKLPFRFGYLDGSGHDHLLITHRDPKPSLPTRRDPAPDR